VTGMDAAVVGAAGAAALASWAAVAVRRARALRSQRLRGAFARDALTAFADRALELESVTAILGAAGETAGRLFDCSKVVTFERTSDEGWEARDAAGGSIGAAPPVSRSSFGWFRHNPLIAASADLGNRRFGAMRGPLREVMDRYEIDLLVPLVEQSKVLAVLGLRLGRAPDELERELLKLFRLELTAACANVKLHKEAARVLTMAKELDLAGAVRLALSPDERDGAVGPLEWAGHYEAAGDAGSDFWAVYPLGTSRVMVVIGDAVGGGLGGTMVSAVVKSCCDAVFDGTRDSVPPGELLSVLNAALYRPGATPAHASCLAVLFELDERRVTYASAGHPAPYRIRFEGDQVSLGVLAGAGPMLGDSAELRYRESRTQLGDREVFLLHTDGLIKTRNPGDEAFGDRRLQRVLAGQVVPAPGQIRDSVLTALTAHRDGARLTDDLAVVLVRVS
jgi:hypothetical protein